MTVTPPNPSEPPSSGSSETEAAAELLLSLRRKQGNWVAWGQACQQLQKAGYSPQQIFEETGFEPVQQNQVIVAAQVYQSLMTGEAAPEVLQRFEQTGSDILYEFRILAQPQRVAAAAIVVEKGIDSEGAQDVAKALKEFTRLSNPPVEFTAYPSDAIAYHYWKLAQQQADLQARSRLIAQALRFAQGEAARQRVESLLTDFSVTRSRSAPRLPFYRLESAEEQPRILPVVGQLPLTTADMQAVPLVEDEGVFHLVKFAGAGAWVALPSWQVVRNAEDPVVIMALGEQLPADSLNPTEEVLLVVDRAERSWSSESYFLIDQAGELAIEWFEEAPEAAILGKVILVLRPKKVLDEDFNKDLWQIEE
ncbi:MAG: hypothetical protein IGS50_23180 [Synechococcales cyanobacterium C42_A2020_086]|jgi:hypothetical protein|nr:hypothetical protein [Synechococcales cyanobacterium C42_A2020_086]